jgi:hypothetical protein
VLPRLATSAREGERAVCEHLTDFLHVQVAATGAQKWF